MENKRSLNDTISLVKKCIPQRLVIMKLAVFFKSSVTSLDETTNDNYREFDKIHLQQDWQTTDSVRTPTSKAVYKQ